MTQQTLSTFHNQPKPNPPTPDQPLPLKQNTKTTPKPKPRPPSSPPKASHIMRDTSEDAFDEILNDGTLGAMSLKALELITDNPDKTVRELLQFGVESEIYPYADRNLIAPRITGLAEEAVIIRPFKRKCGITGKTVLVHRLAPEDWKHQRKHLRKQFSKGPLVKHRLEIKSKSDPMVIHTVIWWSDDSISCSCNDKYHRPSEYRCHHVRGLFKAITGNDMKGAN